MKKVRSAFVILAMMGTGMSIASAMPGSLSSDLRVAASGLNVIEQTQFTYGGRDYCWYDDGWSGSGWYWCGYASRRGFGFGGHSGWHHHPHQPPSAPTKPGVGAGTGPSPVHGSGSSHNPRPAPTVHKPPRHPSHLPRTPVHKPPRHPSHTSP